MLASKGPKSPRNNSEAVLAAEVLSVLMWVLAVTLCGALISRRSLVQQPWLSSLSKMWKGKFCLNFLFSFVKLQNNPDLKEKNSGKFCILVTTVCCLSLKQTHQNPQEVLVMLYPHPLPRSASWDQGPVSHSTAGGASAGRPVYMGPLILDNFTGPHILREIKSCTQELLIWLHFLA